MFLSIIFLIACSLHCFSFLPTLRSLLPTVRTFHPYSFTHRFILLPTVRILFTHSSAYPFTHTSYSFTHSSSPFTCWLILNQSLVYTHLVFVVVVVVECCCCWVLTVVVVKAILKQLIFAILYSRQVSGASHALLLCKLIPLNGTFFKMFLLHDAHNMVKILSTSAND